MMFYMNLLSIVIAVSLDGFGVGITYGMRKIQITILALLIIMCCSGFIVVTAMTIGHLIRTIIPPSSTSMIGSFILIGLGIFIFISIARPQSPKKETQKSANANNSTFQRLKSVLHDPTKADDDQSGIISTSEAIVLGTALALDAFAAGLGAAMLGYSPLFTAAFIALMSGLFLYAGIKLGHLLSKSNIISKLTYLPPIFLISIGVFNLF